MPPNLSQPVYLIHSAAFAGNLLALGRLISEDPSLLAQAEPAYGRTPLLSALYSREEEAAFLIMQHMILYNSGGFEVRDHNLNSVFHIAAYYGFQRVLEFLFTNTSVPATVLSPNSDGRTAFQMAEIAGNTIGKRFLRAAYPDTYLFYHPIPQGVYPEKAGSIILSMREALEKQDFKAIQKILEVRKVSRSCRKFVLNRYTGENLAHRLTKDAPNKHCYTLLPLLPASTLNAKDILGNTPLHYLALRKNMDTRTLALIFKDVPRGKELQNESGETPLHLAVKANSAQMTAFFLQHTNLMTISSYAKSSPLSQALVLGDSSVLEVFFDYFERPLTLPKLTEQIRLRKRAYSKDAEALSTTLVNNQTILHLCGRLQRDTAFPLQDKILQHLLRIHPYLSPEMHKRVGEMLVQTDAIGTSAYSICNVGQRPLWWECFKAYTPGHVEQVIESLFISPSLGTHSPFQESLSTQSQETIETTIRFACSGRTGAALLAYYKPSLLFHAAKFMEVDLYLRLSQQLGLPPMLSTQDKDKTTLHYAAHGQNLMLVQSFLSADPNHTMFKDHPSVASALPDILKMRNGPLALRMITMLQALKFAPFAGQDLLNQAIEHGHEYTVISSMLIWAASCGPACVAELLKPQPGTNNTPLHTAVNYSVDIAIFEAICCYCTEEQYQTRNHQDATAYQLSMAPEKKLYQDSLDKKMFLAVTTAQEVLPTGVMIAQGLASSLHASCLEEAQQHAASSVTGTLGALQQHAASTLPGVSTHGGQTVVTPQVLSFYPDFSRTQALEQVTQTDTENRPTKRRRLDSI